MNWAYPLYIGKKRNWRYSLQGVVLYRTPIPALQYILWFPVLLVIMGVIFTAMKPVDTSLQSTLFSWLPVLESGLTDGYSREVLIRTYMMLAVFGAVVGPTIEELYFRGFLLPRMEYAGKWAPRLHSFLFALYHMWTPWMFVTRTLGIVPLAYAARRRNLNLVITVHILVNLVDVIAGVVFILGMGAII
ncbi:MAG: CPBP family intramembrane metalloprotease [Actinomycetota bacterium]|nr:CPBP family intramembrane metalloprotease [Actinomycetota bacterium]